MCLGEGADYDVVVCSVGVIKRHEVVRKEKEEKRRS